LSVALNYSFLSMGCTTTSRTRISCPEHSMPLPFHPIVHLRRRSHLRRRAYPCRMFHPTRPRNPSCLLVMSGVRSPFSLDVRCKLGLEGHQSAMLLVHGSLSSWMLCEPATNPHFPYLSNLSPPPLVHYINLSMHRTTYL